MMRCLSALGEDIPTSPSASCPRVATSILSWQVWEDDLERAYDRDEKLVQPNRPSSSLYGVIHPKCFSFLFLFCFFFFLFYYIFFWKTIRKI